MDQVLVEVAPAIRRVSKDDRRLIRSLLAGEPEAIATIDAWLQVVLRTEFHSLHGEWDDLRQEIRMRVYRNLRAGRFHGESELRTYVHRIARNTGIDLWRRVSGRREQPGGRRGPFVERAAVPDEAAGVMSRDLLRKILLGVSAEERRLLELVHGDHLSYLEIARKLGVAEGTIKARVSRCRARLLTLRRKLLRHKSR